ncbi:MAG: copper homeostasis protein CutC [Alistipes sp.]|nr:copper homeostasis protein CutC [Alistipes sp.]MBP3432571.1 copper homeostasis protein CutC [Alistipes sp.]
MKTELCAYSVDACRVAARLGVNRVELCASPAEGGVTPSVATIERVAQIDGLDLSVMIRPRGGDFLYSDDEFETMLLDIERARTAGATGVVFGILTANGRVDVERTRRLVEASEGMETTFHRAVDMANDYEQAVEDIIAAGCTRILTSGSYDKAIDGIANIAKAVEIARGRIEIMAGSGVVAANARALADVGVDALHFSAKRMVAGGMEYRNPRISMGGSAAVDEYALRVVDEAEVNEILNLIKL